MEPKVIDLVQHVDDRGFLYEVIHASDEYIDKFGQVYVVGDPVRGTIRAFHAHDELWDYFHIISGSAKFVLFRKEDFDKMDADLLVLDDAFIETQTFVLTARKPQLLIVPAGYFHGWMSLEDNTIMVSTANREYNKKNPDEKRISPYSIGKKIWKVKFK